MAISQKGFMLIFTFVISTPLCRTVQLAYYQKAAWVVHFRLYRMHTVHVCIKVMLVDHAMTHLVWFHSDSCVVIYNAFYGYKYLLHCSEYLLWI